MDLPFSAPLILIVDDTPANLGVAFDHFEDHGYRVAVAQDGEEGVRRAEIIHPHLILLDVMMPGMDGFETCRRLKASDKTRDIPVIFMTALADVHDKLAGFAAGGVDYVTKPIQVEEVLARVTTHLALREARECLAEQNERLEQEIAMRKTAEAALQHANEVLEESVADRTAELEQANARLRAEIIERKEAERRIHYMAHHDALTGLPNRTHLLETLEAAIQTAKQQRSALTVLCLKVGRFNEINKVLGYRCGDRLLQELGRRLTEAVKDNETLARGGDAEFALLVPGGAEAAIRVTQRLMAMLHEPIAVSGLMVDARVSVGIALFPGHGSDPDMLLRRANAATHQARSSRGDYAMYTGGQEEEDTRRLVLMGDLRHAIEHDELLLYCQPKVDIASSRVCGAEALVRWQHPKHGMVSTLEFIKMAEQAGLITPLTNWVLDAAFSQCYAWHEAGLDRALSINLSAQDLRAPGLIDRIRGLFATWGIGSELIQFELTESALMEDPAGAVETLTRLKQLDTQLFVDDFGTGYSSLSYLQKLPIDAMKIDQSFVIPIATSADSEVIVRSAIELGHNLELEVVAEGVESQTVWDRLAALGCDVAQGFFVSEPMPAEQFRIWDEEWSHRVC
ncbi:bifunctional diguanylate cyclase/phosphodiesterase [Azoarcus sp. KH32C]|uniref:putative bifunctional diguanylate cyclase/phosphodiesterase n=1 Tax=Azoarcus sp. KH32C TaxID=748247 RepID=UPI0002385E0F|nr:EAL domain-containing protein [Azoarcus sp. KH32C]BAL27194.1 response regulator receiver modulated diguanylate cyclase/phosphodiesterase [Azoarcus sp. KH32C]